MHTGHHTQLYTDFFSLSRLFIAHAPVVYVYKAANSSFDQNISANATLSYMIDIFFSLSSSPFCVCKKLFANECPHCPGGVGVSAPFDKGPVNRVRRVHQGTIVNPGPP